MLRILQLFNISPKSVSKNKKWKHKKPKNKCKDSIVFILGQTTKLQSSNFEKLLRNKLDITLNWSTFYYFELHTRIPYLALTAVVWN